MSCSAIDDIYLVLKLQGWISDPNWSLRRKKAYSFYGVLTFSLLMAAIGTQVHQILKLIQNGQTDSLFFSLFVFSNEIAVGCYVLILFCLQPRIKDFQRTIQETEKIAFEHAPKTAIKKYDDDCHYSQIGLRTSLFVDSLVVTAWALFPALSMVVNPTINYQKAVTLLTDFNYGLNKTSFFWYIQAFETLEAYQILVNFIIGYFLPIGFCIIVKAQFNLLIRSAECAPDVFSKIVVTVSDGKEATVETADASCSSQEMEPVFDEFQIENYIMHHQHVFRLMTLMKSIIKPILCVEVLKLTTTIANCLVVASIEGPTSRKVFAVPCGCILLTYFAILIWFLNDLRAMVSIVQCYKVGFVFYSLGLKLKKPALQKECLLVVLRSNRQQKFPCFVTSSLKFAFFYKALQMIWNYSSLSLSMTRKAA